MAKRRVCSYAARMGSPRDAVSFRPLCRDDFPLLQRWLGAPHVAAWWRQPLSLEEVHAKYGPRVEDAEPTHVFMIDHGPRPAGWIQWYRWADYPDHARQLGAEPQTAGLDLAIGEPDLTGRGLGSGAIGRFLREIVFADPALTAVVADPEEANKSSLRAFARNGLTVTNTVQLAGEDFSRCVVRRGRFPSDSL